ncbi:hypothetical protein [Amycolatopsis pithecellobii]|uniref:Uncharacterized protein n=1 Tax=Amycolatopsis pithecellobii TaxID=664692 RepID=A0A6N7Z6N3_9PSEU|nr:hypothetical protein [Amycolatopsis pithecellobii]MTD56594.1 hypothetical protein [Amycolatopsis pithecellobii]
MNPLVHTARQLSTEMFAIEIDGAPADRNDVLPCWGPLDRLGIVVDRPFGALGASLLIQLAITAFYDERQARRSREQPAYPDFFLFHFGEYRGNFAPFDFVPSRKEVEVTAGHRAVLGAINDRGVTRLLVPDRAPRELEHVWKEPASAIDRIVSAYAYAPSGRTNASTIALTSCDQRAESNATMTLHPERWPSTYQAMLSQSAAAAERHAKVMHHAGQAEERYENNRTAQGRIRETYRSISVETALQMLYLED